MTTQVTLGHTDTGPLRVDVPTLIDTRQVITASSGGGKSWLLRRLIELIAKQVQVIVIDPEGEFNTLREKFDMLLVGQGGEFQPELRTAKQLARKLAELRVSAIVDLYDLGDWDARRAYLAPFLDGLMSIPKNAYHPLYVPIDEAHQFAPESGGGKQDSPVAASRRAVRFLMSAGRKRAICGALATQRISKLDKDSMADAKNVFVGGITLDVDQERAGDMLGLSKTGRLALRDLAPGQFYCFGPALPRGVSLFRSDPVVTTHPRAGERHLLEVPPASGAIQKIAASLADLPQQVQREADELAAAQRKVLALEQQLRTRPVQVQMAAPEVRETIVTNRVEIPVFKDGEVGRLESAVGQLVQVGGQLAEASQALTSAAGEISGALRAVVNRPAPPPPRPQIVTVTRPAPLPAKTQRSVPENAATKLAKAERSILTILAQRGPRTKRQVAVQTGYAIRGGGFNNAIGALNSAGLIEKSGDTLTITEAGVAQLGTWEPLPTGAALLSYWMSQLAKAERAILETVAGVWPQAIGKDDVATAAGYEVTGGGFNNALGKLRTLELITGSRELRASDELFGD